MTKKTGYKNLEDLIVATIEDIGMEKAAKILKENLPEHEVYYSKKKQGPWKIYFSGTQVDDWSAPTSEREQE